MWFQVFLSNTNNFLNRSIWSIDGTLTDTTSTPSHSEPGSNYNEVLYTFQNWSLTTGYHTQDIRFVWLLVRVSYISPEDFVGVYSPWLTEQT